MPEKKYLLPDIKLSVFKQKALQRAASFEAACFLNSNGYPDRYSTFDVAVAFGIEKEVSPASDYFGELQKFLNRHHDYAFGFLSYDLKNEIEELGSKNPDLLNFPELYFFIPRNLILIKDAEITIKAEDPDILLNEILNAEIEHSEIDFKGIIRSRFSKDEYINTIKKLQKHIAAGDIYEVTICQEFFSETKSFNPVAAFTKLNEVSPVPFSAFFKYKEKYILSASPERFLKKHGNKLVSQPIKGTIKRGRSMLEDEALKNQLKTSQKEQSENVMIVDLVRNDLTKSAAPNTVEVEELYGIYSFKQVHQMISTVVCKANSGIDNIKILQNTFPPGSMTGAPKISAMQLIEQYERSKRSIYSGSVGYFSSEGNFDFSVIIRTILYNDGTGYLSFQTGSAITFDSDPEKEFEECLLKGKAIREVLGV